MIRTVLLVAAVAAVLAPSAQAAIASGGGRGTVDGTRAFSDFGFSVTTRGGSALGHFNCLMAGSARTPGFTLMASVAV